MTAPVNITQNSGIDQLLSGQINQGGGITPGAASALSSTVNANVANSMPSFYQALQGIRGNAVRRGISTGDLGTSYEGDLASAFERNNANAIAGQATNLYESGQSQYLDLLTGQRDANTANKNAQKQEQQQWWSTGLKALGTVASFL